MKKAGMALFGSLAVAGFVALGTTPSIAVGPKAGQATAPGAGQSGRPQVSGVEISNSGRKALSGLPCDSRSDAFGPGQVVELLCDFEPPDSIATAWRPGGAPPPGVDFDDGSYERLGCTDPVTGGPKVERIMIAQDEFGLTVEAEVAIIPFESVEAAFDEAVLTARLGIPGASDVWLDVNGDGHADLVVPSRVHFCDGTSGWYLLYFENLGFGASGRLAADLNGDGRVDGQDLGELFVQWTG